MNVYIFLGPTLSAAEAQTELDAVYLPPASQGDVYRLAASRPNVIGLIDGYFESVPAVWHKEILWAMLQGVHVYGSASIGALRATELSDFGMVGVGAVFEAFRDGLLEDDDEVAVQHAPSEAGFRRLSEPMVNIRCTIRAAADANIIDASTRNALIDLAKSRFYPERNYQILLTDACTAGLPAAQLTALRNWLPVGQIDRKRLDALEMLRRIRLDLASGLVPKKVRYHFEYTYHWDQCWRTAEATDPNRPGSPTLFEDVLEELCLVEHGWQRARMGALMRHLALREARQQAIAVTPQQLETTADVFRLARGLHSPALVQQWLQQNEIQGDDFMRLLEDEARIARVEHLLRPELLTMLLDYLRCTGQYAPLSARALDKRRVLGGRLEHSQQDAVEITNEELLSWYFRERLGVSMPSDVNLRSKNLGFPDVRQLRRAVLREWLYVRVQAGQTSGDLPHAPSERRGVSPPTSGDPAPTFELPGRGLDRISLDQFAGKPALLVFSASGPQPEEVSALDALARQHDAQVLCILSHAESNDLPASSEYIALFDFDGVVHRRFGMKHPGAVLLDAAQRIRSIFPLAGPRDLASKVKPLFTSLSKDESLVHAPVLIIRDVLHLDLCAELIACWHENETKPFDDPATESNSGRRAVTHRVDHWLQPSRLASDVSELIVRRVVPEMQRVFNFEPNGVEQYRIGRYAAAQDQSFRPHRDNRSADTAHRRYSLSISLNTEEYTGGRLRFTEYGPREYGGHSGWALVFSSSLVHEVTSVTSGVRFALITHFLDSRLGVPVRQASTPLTGQT